MRATLRSWDIPQEVVDQYKAAKDGDIIKVPMAEDEKDLRARIIIDNGLPFDQGDLQYDAVMKSDIKEMSGLGSERRGLCQQCV